MDSGSERHEIATDLVVDWKKASDALAEEAEHFLERHAEFHEWLVLHGRADDS